MFNLNAVYFILYTKKSTESFLFKAISVLLLSSYKVSVPTLSKTVTECLLLSRGVFREGGGGDEGRCRPPPYLDFSWKMAFPP